MCLSRYSMASYWIHSMTFSNFVSAEIRLNPIEIFLRRFRIVSWPKFICMVPEVLWGISKMCLRRISIASYWNFCKIFSNCFWAKLNCIFWNYSLTFPKCVLAGIQLHHAKNIVRHFQICLSRNSIASYLNSSKTFSTSVLAEIRMPPIETFFKLFQFVC